MHCMEWLIQQAKYTHNDNSTCTDLSFRRQHSVDVLLHAGLHLIQTTIQIQSYLENCLNLYAHKTHITSTNICIHTRTPTHPLTHPPTHSPTHTHRHRHRHTQHTLLLDLSHYVAVSMVHNCLSQIQDPVAALCINIHQPSFT